MLSSLLHTGKKEAATEFLTRAKDPAKNKPFVDKYFATIEEKNKQIKKENPKVKVIPVEKLRKRYGTAGQLYTEFSQRYPKLGLQKLKPDTKKNLVEIYQRAIVKAQGNNELTTIQTSKSKLKSKITPEPEEIVRKIEQQLLFKKIRLMAAAGDRSEKIKQLEEQTENVQKEYIELHRTAEPEDPILTIDSDLDELDKELEANADQLIAKGIPDIESLKAIFAKRSSKGKGKGKGKKLPPILELLKKPPKGSVFSRVTA